MPRRLGRPRLLTVPERGMTPTWNGNARSVFHGLSMKHGLAHMTRAVFEGCAFGFRDIVDRFAEMGIAERRGARRGRRRREPVLVPNEGDATGRVLRALKNQEATATGAAMLAGVAEGTFASLDEAADGLVELGATYEPDADAKDAYDEAYSLYRAAYAALEPVFDRRRIPSVKVADQLARADPTDLEGLRKVLGSRPIPRKARPLGMGTNRDRRTTLRACLPEVVSSSPAKLAKRRRTSCSLWTPPRCGATMVTRRMKPSVCSRNNSRSGAWCSGRAEHNSTRTKRRL